MAESDDSEGEEKFDQYFPDAVKKDSKVKSNSVDTGTRYVCFIIRLLREGYSLKKISIKYA